MGRGLGHFTAHMKDFIENASQNSAYFDEDFRGHLLTAWNTALPGKPHHLGNSTTCKTQNGNQGTPNGCKGSENMSNQRLLDP